MEDLAIFFKLYAISGGDIEYYVFILFNIRRTWLHTPKCNLIYQMSVPNMSKHYLLDNVSVPYSHELFYFNSMSVPNTS